MKQYWLLGVENDEAIVRKGYEQRGLENLKEENLHFMIQCVFLNEFLMNLTLLFIVER